MPIPKAYRARCSLLFVLLLLCLAPVSEARIDYTKIPPLQIRARMTQADKETAPPDTYVLSVSGHTKRAQPGEWTEWLTLEVDDYAKFSKLYPNLYMRGRWPLVFGASVSPVKGYVKVELETRWAKPRKPAAGDLEFQMKPKKDEVEKALVGDQGGPAVRHEVQLFGASLRLLMVGDGKGKYTVQTSAEYDRKYWALIDACAPKEPLRLKKLLLVDRFIGPDSCRETWEEGIRNLARLGCNAIQIPPGKRYREILVSAGVHKTANAVYSPPGYAFDTGGKEFTDDALKAWAAKLVKPYYDSGYAKEDFAYLALSDEPGWYYPAMNKKWNESPELLARFHAYLQAQGLKPADVGAKSWDEVKTTGRSQVATVEQRRLFYWSAWFFPQESARHFAHVTRMIEAVTYPGLPISTNWNFFAGRFYNPGPIAHNADKQSPDAAMGGHDWFDFGRQRGCTALWTEDWFGDGMAYQWSFYASKLNWASRKGGVTFGGYVIGRTAGGRPGGLAQKVLSIIGHGGKVVKFYTFGPEYAFPGNCWSENTRMYPELIRALKLLAPAEELLYPGKRPRATVAIVQPRSPQPWDQIDMKVASGIMDVTNVGLNAATVGYMAETYDLYMALMHANVPVDFIDEQALSDGDLKDYKVVYLTGANVPVEAQRRLVDWVKAGGTLVTVSNAATADRYNDATTILDSVRGVKETPRKRFHLGRPRKMPAVDALSGKAGAAPVLGLRGTMKLAGASAVATFRDGSPAVSVHEVGKGRAVHFAFLPGLSYWWSRSASKGGLPAGFNEAMRAYVLLPVQLAGVRPPVGVSAAQVETPVLVSKAGAAVSVLNWTGEPRKGVAFTLRAPALVAGGRIGSIESVVHGKMPFQVDGETVRLKMDLDVADILMVRP